jgi:hypothetical protein
MATFFAIPTLAGQAAIAAAIDGDPINLASMVVGDGGGAPVSPLETWTGLTNLRDTIPLQSSTSDVDNPNWRRVEAELDETIGGYTIREAGLLDSDGQLLFVASVPETQKVSEGEGGVIDILTLGLIIVVADTAQVTVQASGASWATQDYVLEQLEAWRTHLAQPVRPYFLAVDSMTVTTPPASPAVGATYVVPSNATGAWVTHINKIAQYRGAEKGWVYVDPPVGHMVGLGGIFYRRTDTGWRSVFASTLEHLEAASSSIFTHPAGVKAMIDGKFPSNASGFLQNNGAGAFSWSSVAFDINGLTAKNVPGLDDPIAGYSTADNANRKFTPRGIRLAILPPKAPGQLTNDGNDNLVWKDGLPDSALAMIYYLGMM